MYKLFKHYINGESECCQLKIFSLLKDILTVFFQCLHVYMGESKVKTFTLTLKEESKNKRLMFQLSWVNVLSYKQHNLGASLFP